MNYCFATYFRCWTFQQQNSAVIVCSVCLQYKTVRLFSSEQSIRMTIVDKFNKNTQFAKTQQFATIYDEFRPYGTHQVDSEDSDVK